MDKACIDSYFLKFINTSEKFVPQMLNLDIDELGVNFSKGCYPGQEVVARLHYLGQQNDAYFLLNLIKRCRLVTHFIVQLQRLLWQEEIDIKVVELLYLR